MKFVLRPPRPVLGLLIGAAVCATQVPAAYAETDATILSAIETRQDGFKTLGKNMRGMRKLFAAGPDFPAIQASAEAIKAEAVQIVDWFPPGSSTDSGLDTEALPAIWADSDQFKRLANDLVVAADALSTSAATSSATKDELMAVKDACSACHRAFKAD